MWMRFKRVLAGCGGGLTRSAGRATPLWDRYKRLHAKLIAGPPLTDEEREEIARAYIHGVCGRRALMPDDSVKYVIGAYTTGEGVVLEVGPSPDARGDLRVDGSTVTVL